MAYCFLLGNTDGIETDYKQLMREKREIPVSSCPSSVENLLYATGGTTDTIAKEEEFAFKTMLNRLDEKAERYESARSERRVRKESLFSKKLRLGIHGGEWIPVDTDGKFWFENYQYIIDEQVVQYQPTETEYGNYYCMDKILASGGRFYDMSYNVVPVRTVAGIF